MTEIKLTLEDPREFARWARSHAGSWPADWAARADQLFTIAHQIEEQVKPAIEEPKEFGSIVRARSVGVETTLWVRDGDGDWRDEHGAICGSFTYFSDIEVLRIGVGADKAELDEATAYSSGYEKGAGDKAAGVTARLRALRADAITGERQDAYDKALKAVGPVE